jgi:cholesterol oxidase
LTTVTAIEPGYRIRTSKGDFAAEQVVLAAGALGTQRLLHRLKAKGTLPNLSDRLGALTRTNSEAILGARATNRDADFTDGVAITSSFHPDASTHIEPVRYGPGANAMGLLQTVLVDGDRWRAARWWPVFLRHPVRNAKALSVRHWSERTIIALVMQSLDNSLTVHYGRSWYGRRRLTTAPGHGAPNPRWIPAGHEAVRLLAEEIGGVPGGSWTDVFNMPVTAHILGGAVIGDSPETGVVDAYHRVFGHPGLHVVDGAAVSANLGVNPALTITAQAERAMSLWPNKGEPDRRPPLGAAYRRISPVESR